MFEQELIRIEEKIEKGPFKDKWSSLNNYEVPKWYKAAKFGIFSHFGPYTIPEYGHDWYVHEMYNDGSFINEHHKKTYGPLSTNGYKQLVGTFKAEKFNSSEWLDLIAKSGAKYYVPVAEHHDGFQMYGSKYSTWNSKFMSPNIDFLEELKSEAKKKKIAFGLSTHRAEHWFFLSPGLKCVSDVHNTEYGDLYWPTKPKYDIGNDSELTEQFLKDWLVRTIELIDNYKPRVLYFDFWIEHKVFKPFVKKILAYYYNSMLETYGDCGVVNYKHDAIAYGCAIRDVERGHFSQIQYDYWQTCTSCSKNSWIYTKANQYKSDIEIIQTLIDVISKNGNLLLNIGPKADGSICVEEKNILTKVGNWIRINEEAIFNTKPWKIYGEGSTNVKDGDFGEDSSTIYNSRDIRFTSNANKIYAFLMNPEGEKKFRIKHFGLEGRQLKKNNYIINLSSVSGTPIKGWKREKEFLEIEFTKNLDKYPEVICLELS